MTPKKLGRFKIVAELGRGAMGIVYKGIDEKIQRPVALKVLEYKAQIKDGSDMQADERFVVEARAAGQLAHPNILTIYDIGEHRGKTYIAMEYLEGGTLQDMVEQNRLKDYEEVFDIVRQIASALDLAHSKGIIHRDIKPSNIMMAHGNIPKITDFGLARVADSNLTATGTVLGTPNYMAPEQVQGRKIDGRADLFALGVMLYELLTGEKPFSGDSITSVIYRVVNDEPIPPRKLNLDLPQGMDVFMNKALAKDPNSRYQSGKEFMEGMEALRKGLLAVEAVTEPGKTQKIDNAAAAPNAGQSPARIAYENISKKINVKFAVGGASAVLLLLIIAITSMGNKDDNSAKPAAAVRPTPAPAAAETAVKKETARNTKPVKLTQPAIGKKKEKAVKKAQAAKPSTAKKKITVAKTSYLSIRSEPKGARIYINSKYVGKTPYMKRKYKRKTYKVRVAMTGYKDDEFKVKLKNNRILNVKLKKIGNAGTSVNGEEVGFWNTLFKPKAVGNIGTLIVRARKGDKVTIDGKNYKKFPVVLENIPIGKHNIFIVRKGRKPFLKTVSLNRGQTLTIFPKF
ncbi:MAG: hypothetical protein IEMM0002_0512 [bacterium]|nr:MAG: hypothetical protein IEMM0002_0512 [bacterium]